MAYTMTTHDMMITGAHVVTPNGVVDHNIVINDGKIMAITPKEPACSNRIRADGLVALPGVIDTHVHYGVYTPINKAATTESHAAAIGGVTTMIRMLRLGSSYKTGLGRQLDASSNKHYVDYGVHASILTKSQVPEMKHCADSGVASFKIYMNLGGKIGHVYMDMEPGSSALSEAQVEISPALVEEIVKSAARLGIPVSVHAEDYESCACAMHESQQKGKDGLGAWSESRSPEYEAKAIESVCKMARQHGCAVYLVHIGSARALEQIRLERSRGTKIRVETCPHYLTISHEGRSDNLAKVMPPVRSRSDIEAVWSALIRGEIDTIGTDHVANTQKVKLGETGDVWRALAGFPGIGALLPILVSEGLNRGRLSLERLAAVTSTNAAKIFSMTPRKGALTAGADADVTLVDTRMNKILDHSMFGGHSDYSIYDGMRLRGWPVKTIVRGELVADDFEVVGRVGHGRLVSPTR